MPFRPLVDPLADHLDLFGSERGLAHRHPGLAAFAENTAQQQALSGVAGDDRRAGDPALERQLPVVEPQLAPRALRPMTLITGRLEDGPNVAREIYGLIGGGAAVERRGRRAHTNEAEQ